MSALLTAARPYARAAFEVASENGAVEQWSRALSGLAAIVSDPVARRLLDDPRYSAGQVVDFIAGVLGDALDAERRNFVRLLVTNRRLGLACEVVKLFEQYCADAERSSVVEIVSAQPLGEAQRDALCRAVERHTGRKVIADCRTDETLLGGAVVRIGDFVADGSVKTRLQKLSQTLAR